MSDTSKISATDAVPVAGFSRHRFFGTRALVVALCGFGLLLRSLYLDWQPLWWDEGYTVYFATEPLGQMLWLTARDIHPPLYYGMLHAWVSGLGTASPVVLRLFSVMVGALSIPLFGWLVSRFFPLSNASFLEQSNVHKPSKMLPSASHLPILLIALLLFVLNPLHIYYSQEVRMYGLALAFTMWSTAAFWQLIQDSEGRSILNLSWFAYLIATTLALYTLYYSALIPIAHLLYTLALLVWPGLRPQIAAGRADAAKRLWHLFSAQIAVAILYLPWVIYAASELVTYVDNKIGADNDSPFDPFTYLGRHLIAFVGGHLPLPANTLSLVGLLVGIVASFGVTMFLVRGWLSGWFRLTSPWETLAKPQRRQESTERTSAVFAAWRVDIASVRRKRTKRGEMAGEQTAHKQQNDLDPLPALWCLWLVPTALGYLLNQQLTFFPDGGERLLLITLPYFLILVAVGVYRMKWRWVRRAGFTVILLCSLIGTILFYYTPRFPDRDYRGVITSIMQQGTPQGRVLALFPWQVGYWRAYAPEARQIGPHLVLVSHETLEWGEQMRQQIDIELAKDGSLWFPAPLGLGSELPKEIEGYLWSLARGEQESDPASTQLLNIDARWANPTTFLTRWIESERLPLSPQEVRFDDLTLTATAVHPNQGQSANDVITVGLQWHIGTTSEQPSHRVTLRLVDQEGRVWSNRDYGWEDVLAEGQLKSTWTDWTGLLVPAGLAPGEYSVVVGLSQENTLAPSMLDMESDSDLGHLVEASPIDAKLPSGEFQRFVSIGTIQVINPSAILSPLRLPIEAPLTPPAVRKGVTFLGSSGNPEGISPEGIAFQSGTAVPLVLYLQANEQTTDQHLTLSLLDMQGAGVAGWADWPLPSYPLSSWPIGGLVQMPADLQLPATLPSGEYQLISGLLDPQSQDKSEPVELGTVAIWQRSADFEPPVVQLPIDANENPIRLGTHVNLLGSTLDLQKNEEAGTVISIQLHWRVLQPLLPQHHIFVHLTSRDGAVPLAQHDDQPIIVDSNSASAPDQTIAAPTGSWQPGEYLTTVHTLALPQEVDITNSNLPHLGEAGWQIRVGLYAPVTGARLPAFNGDELIGDSVPLIAD